MTEENGEQKLNLLKNDKEFVVPGDNIVSSMEFLPGKNTFRDGDSIYSKRLGIVHLENHVISVVPLSGGYTPQMGDMVIGEVDDVQSNGWFIDIKSPHSAYLSLSGVRGFIRQGTDLTTVFSAGELIYVKIASYNKQGVSLSMFDDRARKLSNGKIIIVEPVKVPRIIGKQGSMISLIKMKTGSNIVVGQNGLIWINGGDDALATTVIKMVETESHKEGLTDRIEKYLEEHAPKTPIQPAPTDQQNGGGFEMKDGPDSPESNIFSDEGGERN